MPSYGKTINEFRARCDCCGSVRHDCATAYRMVQRNILRGILEYSPEPETLCAACRREIGGRNFRLDAKHGRMMAAKLAGVA